MPNTKPATQDFVTVRDIKENVVIEKDGQMLMILLASSVNFSLKSLEEQQAILMQFQNFLNTLDFSLQIYIQSRKLDIQPYLEVLAGLDAQQDNALMKVQLREYIEFIRTFADNIDVMSKNFFVVVPFSPSTVNVKKGITNLFSPSTKSSSLPSEMKFEESRTQLEQRAGVVTEGLARVGVRTITLDKDDLVELFYHIYNPDDKTGSAPVVDNI
jgi:type IV secretory pathway VirB4 component